MSRSRAWAVGFCLALVVVAGAACTTTSSPQTTPTTASKSTLYSWGQQNKADLEAFARDVSPLQGEMQTGASAEARSTCSRAAQDVLALQGDPPLPEDNSPWQTALTTLGKGMASCSAGDFTTAAPEIQTGEGEFARLGALMTQQKG